MDETTNVKPTAPVTPVAETEAKAEVTPEVVATPAEVTIEDAAEATEVATEGTPEDTAKKTEETAA